MRSKLLVVLWAGVGALLVGAGVAGAQIPCGESNLGKTAQLDAALDNADAITVPTDVFRCNLVSGAVYNRAIPIPPAP